jgi:very-short-patch-repair endonuclease
MTLAAGQHWVVSRRQLIALGLSPAAIKHRVQRGRLHPVYRGVYAVGRPYVDRNGRWMAAVLACGDGAVLSHRSAAALWEIGEEGEVVEVSVPRDVRRRDIRVHVRTRLDPRNTTTHLAIPVTSPTQTLTDLALQLPPAAVERAVNEADRLDRVPWYQLEAELETAPPGPGVARLRELLARATLKLTDSELERMFLPIARRAGLPEPLTQERVDGFPVDFYWPGLGLVVETDGLRYHRTPATQARDARRDQAHTAAGRVPLRFTHADVAFDVARVERTLARVARRLESRRAA